MASLFEMTMNGQLGGSLGATGAGNKEASLPLAAALCRVFKDSNKGILGSISSESWVSIEKSTQGIAGIWGGRKADGWLKALTQGINPGGAPEISAPIGGKSGGWDRAA